ncbi:MAG: hypothetical protein KKC24_18005 [Gammaproteobacteria bacterium]|nr:hypothetical protein [Gammaproteobacteria bacterium]MBU0820742.1 hypothetical protein [Gammaproteobacteria bacterium]MBU0843279.1 hypothetical protein [Gammaproteobacteria bacterium]MBU1840441.1 hypothetical protein [Gammaproteobacteria bacterium]
MKKPMSEHDWRILLVEAPPSSSGPPSQMGMIRQAIVLSSLTSIELDALERIAVEHGLPLLGYLIKPLKQSDLRNLLTLISL